MSERLQEVADIPRQFVKEGTQFVNRCTKPSAEGQRVFHSALYIDGLKWARGNMAQGTLRAGSSGGWCMEDKAVMESKTVKTAVRALHPSLTRPCPSFAVLRHVLGKYKQLCRAIAIGFGVMGVIGYVVKLIHIPINNILVGGA